MANNGTAPAPQIAKELPDDLNLRLESLRCSKCDRFLGYYAIVEGTIAIKCRRCKAYSIIDARASWELDKAGKLALE